MAVEKAIGSSSLVEVVDRILDKGIVIDAWMRVSLPASRCWPSRPGLSWRRWKRT